MNQKVPLFSIYWDEEDINNVIEVIKSGKNWANGLDINKFEEDLSEYFNINYVVTFNNGTSALHAILLAYEIRPGDEIIVPSFTFISTANSCLFVGAKPIFSEIEWKFFGLDPEDVIKKITPRTKAIIPVHYGGCPCEIKELREIADDNNLLLIEDNAESMGSKVNGKMSGTFGDSAILSFCQNKIISTGEGGAVLTDSKIIADKLKLIRSHGRLEISDYFSSGESFQYTTLGYNFRIPTMNAALGISQLHKIDEIIEMRRKNAKIYSNFLKINSQITIPIIPEERFHVYQMYSVLVEKSKRNALMSYLLEKGIASKVYFDPIHLTKFYQQKLNHKIGELPVTEEISNSILSLPMFPSLKEEEILLVCSTINRFFEGLN